jgi:glycine/D-amino acid oxidase-like deaminating enzyme
VLFALAYGANGIPFAALAAEILTATVLGERHRFQATFDFRR